METFLFLSHPTISGRINNYSVKVTLHRCLQSGSIHSFALYPWPHLFLTITLWSKYIISSSNNSRSILQMRKQRLQDVQCLLKVTHFVINQGLICLRACALGHLLALYVDLVDEFSPIARNDIPEDKTGPTFLILTHLRTGRRDGSKDELYFPSVSRKSTLFWIWNLCWLE